MSKIMANFSALIFILTLPVSMVYGISMEVRRVSDHGLSGLVDFGSISTTTAYAQGAQYIIVRYLPGEEDTDSLKVFSDNQNWLGGVSERGGLVRNNTPTERVPVYWMAFSGVQQNINFNALNESTWKSLKDQNDPGFSSVDPTHTAIPLFPTGTSYIYFGAKASPTTSPAFYSSDIKIRNGAVEINGPNFNNGFGSFHGVFQPNKNPLFEIPIGVESSSNVGLYVYDRKGIKIRNLVSGELTPGNYTITWDGRNEAGGRLGSGVLMLLLEIGKEKFKKKMVIIN